MSRVDEEGEDEEGEEEEQVAGLKEVAGQGTGLSMGRGCVEVIEDVSGDCDEDGTCPVKYPGILSQRSLHTSSRISEPA